MLRHRVRYCGFELAPANWILIISACIICSGCVIIDTISREGYERTRYAGFIQVRLLDEGSDDAGATIRAARLRIVGMRIGASSGIGYFEDYLLVLPLDCHVAILVESEAQLVGARELLRNGLNGRDPCLAIF